MKTKIGTVMKSVGAVMTIGGAAMMGTGMMAGNAVKKKAKKTAIRAIDTMDDFITGVQNLMK
ncbi:MAG: hypothetical protein IJO14_06725 [Clostridia bacterium]|nr:hypothetical protein [Clostridia bacterium]